MMRRWTCVLWTALTATALAGCGGQLDGSAGDENIAAFGNGAPNGSHFDLNLIGVSNVLTQGNSGGSVIHVPLDGNCQINLAQGSFEVLDSNCTDGSASFQLPNPDPTNSGTTTYSVFVRAYLYYYNSKGQLVRVPLFDSSLQNYYWQYDNNGLKNLQMRFYQVSTTVPTP